MSFDPAIRHPQRPCCHSRRPCGQPRESGDPWVLRLSTTVILALSGTSLGAQSDTAVRVTFGGFIDSYYAWDFGRPPSGDRAFASGNLFTTQPARHHEFNVNLALLDATLRGPRIRGRLALQFGTSVQSNYFAEPRRGLVSGPDVAQFLQEAYAGYQLTPSLWVDGGVFFSNMGMEGWISRDNPTYTRSLVADYSPYYSTGVRATWQVAKPLTVRLDLVNGWQVISEANSGKGFGARVDYTPRAGSTLSYYAYLGDESASNLRRTFHGVGANIELAKRLRVLGAIDVGREERDAGEDAATWYGVTAVLRAQVTPRVAVSGRLERFDDGDGVLIATGNVGGRSLPAFRATGASLGLDVQPQSRVSWRSEVRGFANDGAIFPDRAGTSRRSTLMTTSLALSF